MVFDDFNSFFFCHESSIDTHIDTNQLILLSQARTQKTKKSVADGHLTSSKEVEKMGHVMDICETDSVKKIACWSKCILICTEKENVLLEGNELKDLEAKWLRWGQIWFTKGANSQRWHGGEPAVGRILQIPLLPGGLGDPQQIKTVAMKRSLFRQQWRSCGNQV